MQAAQPELLDRLNGLIKWMAAGVTAAAAGSSLGARTVLVGLVVLMAIDWITGFNAAYIRGEVSSEVGRKGLVAKGQILLLILAIHVVEKLAGYEMQLELFGAGGFCVNEAISIVENVARSGVWIPGSLVRALVKVKQLSPRGATRAELDQLRDDNRAEVDDLRHATRLENDAAVHAARQEVDRAAQALPPVGK